MITDVSDPVPIDGFSCQLLINWFSCEASETGVGTYGGVVVVLCVCVFVCIYYLV